jgi:hypothetical protein
MKIIWVLIERNRDNEVCALCVSHDKDKLKERIRTHEKWVDQDSGDSYTEWGYSTRLEISKIKII